MIKRNLILIFFLFLNTEAAIGKIKVCKIEFNEKNGLEALENKINKRINLATLDRENIFKCYKIGVNHNQNKIPIENSPIYACCKNQ